MTTVVYRNGVMASDSAVTVGDARMGSLRKVFRLKDGSLVGFAGDYARGVHFLKWLDTDRSEDAPSLEDSTCMVVSPERVITVYQGEESLPILYGPDQDYIAIGSGYTFALGACHQGASAEEAAQASCFHDVYSALPLQVERLSG